MKTQCNEPVKKQLIGLRFQEGKERIHVMLPNVEVRF